MRKVKPSTSPRKNQDDAASASELEFDELDEDEPAMNQSSQPTQTSIEQDTTSQIVVQLVSSRSDFDCPLYSLPIFRCPM